MKKMVGVVAFLIGGWSAGMISAQGLNLGVSPEPVQISLVSEVDAAAPGQAFRVAVKVDHDEHWHTYGKVLPAEIVGKPTQLKWTLPAGWVSEDLPWPATVEVDSTGGEKSEGYEGTVYLPAKLIPPAGLGVGDTALIGVELSGLICDPMTCRPIRLETTLKLPIAAESTANEEIAGRIDEAIAASKEAPESKKEEEGPAPSSGAPDADPGGSSDSSKPSAGGGSSTDADAPRSFGVYLLFAFIGGLILNVMPCVFPVLGIKIMSVVKQAGGDKRHVVVHGLAYTSGILICFWILGGLVIFLGKTWGGQLQSASFVFGLSAFFLVFALNMAGVFEIGASAVGVGSELQSKHGLSGSFFTGLLAVVVATPCSAPFLGAALGYTVTLEPVPAMLMFTMIALGLASPFLLLSLMPSVVSALPRPGAWMESFKQGMSFLLFATVTYLLWVLTSKVDGQPMLFLMFGLVLVALGCWIYGRWMLPHKTRRTRAVALLLTCLAIGGGLYLGWPEARSGEVNQGSQQEGGLTWEAWSPERVAELREDKVPVYIDFTAKWCFTCQVNKRVYRDERVKEAIQNKGIVLLKADWTNVDPRIEKALAELGKAAVPVNVLYLPGVTEPWILSELLTADEVLAAFNRLP